MTHPEYWGKCTIDCERMPDCAVCGTRKAPQGRSAPLGAYYCDTDCHGYFQDPQPGHLWPGELARMDAPEDDE